MVVEGRGGEIKRGERLFWLTRKKKSAGRRWGVEVVRGGEKFRGGFGGMVRGGRTVLGVGGGGGVGVGSVDRRGWAGGAGHVWPYVLI